VFAYLSLSLLLTLTLLLLASEHVSSSDAKRASSNDMTIPGGEYPVARIYCTYILVNIF
jgi:hypothetical protein